MMTGNYRYLAVLCLVWLGMVLGISFLEAWVKFRAPSLTVPVGLDVGRHVFQAFNKVEICLGIVSIILIPLLKPSRKEYAPLVILWIILIIQTAWLLPGLSDRVDMVLKGDRLTDSHLHTVYVILEILKAMILAVCGYRFLFRKIRPSSEI